MKFKVDENMPDAVALYLREQGHDAHTLREEEMKGAADHSLFAVCQLEQRALVTMDLDFADLRRYPPVGGAGIIVLRLAHQHRDYVLSFLPRILRLLATEPLAECLWIVDEIRTRIRKEP